MKLTRPLALLAAASCRSQANAELTRAEIQAIDVGGVTYADTPL